MVRDKKEITKLITYITLGDGGLYKATPTSNAQFIMNMKSEHEDYINYCAHILESITGTRKYNRKDYNTDGCNRKPQTRLESRRHPLLTKIHSRIYIDKYKGIDPHSLKLLDAECLAILYQCDGSLKKDSRCNSHSVTLNLKRLSYGDLFLLKKALKDKLDLEWNIHKQNQYYYLYLRTNDIPKFMNIIRDYMQQSFMYKVLPNV